MQLPCQTINYFKSINIGIFVFSLLDSVCIMLHNVQNAMQNATLFVMLGKIVS